MTIISALPFTLTNGSNADASQVMANLDQIRDDVNANAAPNLGGYRGAVVYSTAATTIPAALGEAKIAFNSELIDTDSIHSTSVNTTRLTVPAGVTRIRLIGAFRFSNTHATGRWGLSFSKNNASLTPLTVRVDVEGNAEGIVNSQLTSPTLPVVAGDYFEFSVSAFAGTSDTSDVNNTWFEMQILG